MHSHTCTTSGSSHFDVNSDDHSPPSSASGVTFVIALQTAKLRFPPWEHFQSFDFKPQPLKLNRKTLYIFISCLIHHLHIYSPLIPHIFTKSIHMFIILKHSNMNLDIQIFTYKFTRISIINQYNN